MFEKYKGKPFSFKVNKKKLPINTLNFDRLEEFNEIYLYCKKHFRETKPTPSGGISIAPNERMHERYFVLKANQRYELDVVCAEGCYRFLLMGKKKETNTIRGTTAVRQIYKKAYELEIDLMKYACTTEEGKKIKEEIMSPHIKVLVPAVLNKKLSNIYHLDLKSSYASRIVEEYPELYTLYNYMYQQRKFKNEFYKHVLTNSIGCFQSRYCPDILLPRHTKPFMLAKLAKVAVNGTVKLVDYYVNKLRENGFVPILTNTDGIWYYAPNNEPYHDDREGVELGCWENDHKNCDFLMTSVGSYQYVENGVCHSVVRGKCNLDSIEPDRDKWEFGFILIMKEVCMYNFDKEKGVVEVWQ